jgi:nucleotide-binding universal stress UspA family protein
MPATLTSPDPTAAPVAPREKLSILLVASDGTAAVDSALAVARQLAARDSARVNVVTAIEPLPIVSPEMLLPITPEMEVRRRTELAARVREQVTKVAPESKSWSVSQVEGQADAMIARTARECGADLIVIGLGEHRIVDRLFGGETALRVLRLADAPLLAVVPGATAIPVRAVAAVDFSETSARAVRAALALLGPGATLTLTHVVPRDIAVGIWPAWDDAYQRAVADSFAQMKKELAVPAGVTVETTVLHGDPAHEVLKFAEGTKADVIVTGSHGHNFVVRTMLGRVSTKLIRGAHCSVLVVPPHRRVH